MDDIFIPTETVEQNLNVIGEVIFILRRYGFELNCRKCLFLREKIEFLGYLISKEGITISPRHTEAVQNFRQPKTVNEVQRFSGFVSYFRKFLKDFAIKALPLYPFKERNRIRF